MLHILLFVLKIIGIILGILLGVVLLALTLVLFVPVRYRLEAVRVEGEGNPPIEIRAKVTWLFHLLNVKLHYPAEVYLRARIMLFPIFRMPPKQNKSHKSNRNTRKNKKQKKNKDKNVPEKKDKTGSGHKTNNKDISNDKINHSDINDKDDSYKDSSYKDDSYNDISLSNTNDYNKNDNNKSIKDTDNKDTNSKSGNDTAKSNGEKGNNISSDTASDTKKKKFNFSLKATLRKIWKFFQNIWYTIKKICDRIREILENIEYYWNILQSDTFKQSYALCKDELGAVFKYIKPRKFKADLIIGTDDPASTGQILSYYGILYPFIGNHVTVVGDFEQKRIEGSVFIKGRIKLFTILKAAKRIYFSKDIKKLIQLFKKEDV